jgi:ABC-type phosphate transport system permease subunit
LIGRRRRRHDPREQPAGTRQRVRGVLPAAIAGVLVAAALLAWPAGAAADGGPALTIDPATATVAPGQTFTVNIDQTAAVTTTGAQTNVVFNAKLMQLQDFALGDAYTASNAVLAFGITDLGTSTDKAAEIKRANKIGVLENAAGFLLPGSGTIPAGTTVFLKLTFVATPGDGGDAKMTLIRASMIDEQGAPLEPTVARGTVTVSPGYVAPSTEPGASTAPGSSAPASPGASPVPAGASEVPIPPIPPTGPVTLSLAPTSITLRAGDTGRVFLIAKADGNLTSAAADLTFNKDQLQVVEVDTGPGWDNAVAIAVTTDKTNSSMDAAVAEANTTGKLQQAGAFFVPGAPDLPYGETVFSMVLVSAKSDGTFNLSIDNGQALGPTGETLTTVVDPASLTPPPPKPLEIDLTLVVPLVVLAVLVLGSLLLWRSGRIPVRVRRRWPYYVSMALGLIPVVLFLLIVAMIVGNAAPVVVDPGIGALFGGQFLDIKGNLVTGYAILPALWGTVLVTTIAVLIGLPISLALAIVAVDFPMGPIGRLVRPVVAVFSGIPPVVYAVSVPVFVAAFMIPKFAGNLTVDTFNAAAIGADPASWPPADVPYSPGAFPWILTRGTGGNSTLLGGLLVGLFLIPFLTPMFVDALANVPRAAREASLALGANRTYTLRRVVLPRATPALAGASTLALLKALGDAVIVLFAVGYAATIPDPPFDVLERAAPLGAWGANLIGSFDTLSAACSPQSCAVGYTSALLLLLIAGIAVLVLTYLQARARRSVAT